MKLVKFSNLHIYLFYLFLLSIPFQTRKVFLTEHSFYSGAFTEYTTFFIYASDILLILALFFWLVYSKKLHKHFNVENLCSKINVLIHILDSRLRGNDRSGIFQRFSNINKLSSVWLLLFIFIIWTIISAIVNNNYTEISTFYIFKFIELSLLIVYIYFNLRNKKRLITALFTISLAGFFQGLITIYQFVYQSPLFKHPFLHKLTGESTVYPQVPGIAKIVVDNEKLVRAYGTFPHPNLLGGFLIVSILISIYLLLKHKDYILSRLNFKYNNINTNKSQVRIPSLLLSLFWIILIFTQITALLFTFSRTTWIGLLISLFLVGIFYIHHFLIVSRETIKQNGLAKFVIVSLSNYDKFSVLPTFRQAQGDILKFISNKMLRQKIKNRIVSRETISMNLNNKRSKFSINNSASSVSAKEQNCYYRLFCRFKELVVIVLLTLILIITYFPHINSRLNEEFLISDSSSSNYLPANYAVNDRIFYNNVSRETISENFLLGSGPGTFIFQINSYLIKNNINQKLEPWQYQPAHNIYLLIISEIGIIGFTIFALFVIKIMVYSFRIIKNPLNKLSYLNNNSQIVSRETIEQNNLAKFVIVSLSNYDKFSVLPTFRQAQSDTVVKSRNLLNYFLLSILISFLFIGLFDHYFWTLQQGRLIFWLVLGLMLASNNVISREDKH